MGSLQYGWWRPPRGAGATYWAILLLIAGIAIAIGGQWTHSWLWTIQSALLLVTAAGLWLEQRWARWVGLAAVTLVIGMTFGQILQRGITPRDVFRIFLFLGTGWCLFQLPFGTADDRANENDHGGGPTSLVALLPELPYVDAQVISRAIRAAWREEIPFEDVEDGAERFVVGDPPLMMVKRDDQMFLINVFDQPYFRDSDEIADGIPDLRTAAVVREHRAWISIDCPGITPGDKDALAAAYRQIGTLLAELIDDDCLAIALPQYAEVHPYQPSLLAALRSPDPVEAIRQRFPPPVIRVADDDPRMLAAVQEARRRWNEFTLAFQERTPDQQFSVKVPLEDAEFLWVTPTALEGDSIYGVLDNDPLHRKDLAAGSRVTARIDTLNDWLYTDRNGKMQGGFTIEVLREAALRQQQALENGNAE